MNNELQSRLLRSAKNILNNFSHLITQDLAEHLAEEGYIYGAEVRNPTLANDGTLFLQIEATTKPITLVFGAGVEALTHVDSFVGTTLNPTTNLLTPFNYKPSIATAPTAIVRTSTAVTTLGTQRGNAQTGSGSGGTGVGGSASTRPSTLAPGEKLTLRLTNEGGTNKSVSVGVYWTETIG